MADRTPNDPPRCGHHGNELTDIPGHGLRCPWCFPEFFPEHSFLVKFAELEAFADAAGFRVVPIPDDNTRALAARLRTCPTCGCDCEQFGRCPDPWHVGGSEDTRSEAE